MKPTSASAFQTSGQPAVFLDRDGTLIEDGGNLRDPGEVIFYEETIESLRKLQEHFRLFIVTNQSGVGKGLITAEEAARVNAFVVDHLRRNGVSIADLYCCPHRREDGCDCIKPKPYFLEKAAEKHGLDLRRSFVVGDHPGDSELALGVGAAGIHVLTGHGLKHMREIPTGAIAVPGIRDAVDWMLACHEMRLQETRHVGLIAAAADRLNLEALSRSPRKRSMDWGPSCLTKKPLLAFLKRSDVRVSTP